MKNDPSTSHIPILLCTGQGEETIVKGLDVGGVDYITKPFSMRQLLVRVGVLVQRFVRADR
jgi:two-component system alkaline phosphatase synthesis response regulator PhoP